MFNVYFYIKDAYFNICVNYGNTHSARVSLLYSRCEWTILTHCSLNFKGEKMTGDSGCKEDISHITSVAILTKIQGQFSGLQ